ncbi:unnamed protein product [Enterobius vermicularis]|uniref:C-type lectin domain-containing protein n=1 Tax=Enterobius vermicularis TaxID=51028 RepID=A0A0N4VHW4_ENTVE|nr:unnamed protein product [Enterobius vermicularis]
MGAHLPIICNDDINTFVSNMLYSVGVNDVFIDNSVLTELGGTSSYGHSDLTFCPYENWKYGHPVISTEDRKPCTVMRRGKNGTALWSSFKCTYKVQGYVCERPCFEENQLLET